jgi:hypothetical protein
MCKEDIINSVIARNYSLFLTTFKCANKKHNKVHFVDISNHFIYNGDMDSLKWLLRTMSINGNIRL